MISKLKQTLYKLHALVWVSRAKDAPEMLEELKEIESEILADEFAMFSGTCGHVNNAGLCTRDSEEPPFLRCEIGNCKNLSWITIKENAK